MVFGQAKGFALINSTQAKLSSTWVHYWLHYSSLNTWQFWGLATLLVLPLFVLYLRIDRTKALQIGFFGFSVHVWTSKLDEVAVVNGFWNYPFTLVPYLTSSLVLDASLTPVTLMLVYQWTINRKRNFYLYAIGASIGLALLVRPAFATFSLFSVNRVMYYFVLLFINIGVAIVSKWTTDIFLHFQREGNVFPRRVLRKEVNDTPIVRTVEKDKSIFRRKRVTRRI